MKKLLLALGASACAIGAFAATLNGEVGSDFDDTPFSDGDKFNPRLDDNGGDPTLGTSAGLFWYTEDVEGVEATWKKTESEPQSTYLDIESTTKPLYRTIDNSADNEVTGKDIGTGIYIDTKVQFTAGDPTMPSDDQDAKLAIWLCGNNAEGEPSTTTNFMVRAASYASGSLVATNYVMAYSGTDMEAITGGDFCQLTVKSIADIDTADGERVGFVVFVNGTALTVADPENQPVFATSEGLTPVAKKWNDKNALLPSLLVVEDDDDKQISMVGFYGKGAVDEVFFKSEAPDFAADDKTVTITLDDGVDSVKYKIDDGDEVTYTVPFFVPYGDTVTITDVDYKAGAKPLGFDNPVVVTNDMTIKILTANWVVGETGYETLDEALTALNSVEGEKILTLADDVNEKLEVSSNMTLDLAGHKITAPDATNPAVYVYAGTLTIIDSSVSQSGEIAAVGATPVIWAESEDESVPAIVEIEQAIVTGGVMGDSLTIKCGKFTPGTANEDTFYLADYIADGYDVEDEMVEGYWVVTKVEEPAATPITADDVALGAETAEYDGTNLKPTVTVTVGGETLTAVTDYEVTYSADQMVNVGTYTITVTGKGDYTGEVVKTFTVTAKAITPTLELSADTGVLSEELEFPAVTVKDDQTTLDEANYDCEWNPSEITVAGDYVVTVTLKGNYSGSKTATFTVTAPAPIEKPEVAPGEEGAVVEASDADEAIEKVTVNIEVPEGIGDTYKDLFKTVATANGNGTFTVTVQLTQDAEAAITADANDAVEAIDLAAAAAATAGDALEAVAVSGATPGIYYYIEVADGLGADAKKHNGNRAMAGSNGNVTIPMPNPKAIENANGNARFFRVKADVKGDE